jgi:type IV pilus assembly protein PilB
VSTRPTNDNRGAVTRLIDMAFEPFLISHMIASVAQRLVRRLCRNCAEPSEPDLKLWPPNSLTMPRWPR